MPISCSSNRALHVVSSCSVASPVVTCGRGALVRSCLYQEDLVNVKIQDYFISVFVRLFKNKCCTQFLSYCFVNSSFGGAHK
jgi:hypothetical protein